VRTDLEKGSLEESITSPVAEQQLKIIFRLFIAIGLLQPAITWYKTRHAGGQAHYYSRTGTSKQRQVKLHWFRSLTIPSQQ